MAARGKADALKHSVTQNSIMSDGAASDRLAIRELIENWAIWRDAMMWDRLRTVWHDDGRISVTWSQSHADDFIASCKMMYERGSQVTHMLGGASIEVNNSRAIAQTKCQIAARAPVDGVLCDVASTGRFYDFLEKRNGRWGLVLRQPIYEKDRIDPVEPCVTLQLDAAILAKYPSGYQHLGYVLHKAGYAVKDDLPTLDGPIVEKLYEDGAAWLRGENLTR